MGEYSAESIESELTEFAGELMVVLESGDEYELHIHDTEFPGDGFVETEGMVDEEYRVVRFPASVVEHTYIHKES
jgi:hypothetical protein